MNNKIILIIIVVFVAILIAFVFRDLFYPNNNTHTERYIHSQRISLDMGQIQSAVDIFTNQYRDKSISFDSINWEVLLKDDRFRMFVPSVEAITDQWGSVLVLKPRHRQSENKSYYQVYSKGPNMIDDDGKLDDIIADRGYIPDDD